MIQSAELNGITLHDLSVATAGIKLGRDKVSGLGEPVFRVSATDKSGEDGGTVSSVLLGMRPISLGGKVSGTNNATFIANRRLLQQACATTRDSHGRPVPKRLYFVTLDGVEYFIDTHVRALNVATEYNTMADFLIQLIAPDPVIYVNDPETSGQVGRPVGGGVGFPWVFNPTIEFGATTGGTIAIDHYGNAGTWPIVIFRGPAVNPTLVNQTADKIMALNVTLTAGQTVTIDMKEHTVVLDGATNYLPYKTAESEWFSLQPGNNLLNFSTGNTSDTGTVELTYYPAMLGV